MNRARQVDTCNDLQYGGVDANDVGSNLGEISEDYDEA